MHHPGEGRLDLSAKELQRGRGRKGKGSFDCSGDTTLVSSHVDADLRTATIYRGDTEGRTGEVSGNASWPGSGQAFDEEGGDPMEDKGRHWQFGTSSEMTTMHCDDLGTVSKDSCKKEQERFDAKPRNVI